MFASRSEKYIALHNELNETLNNKWITLVTMVVYHLVVLILPTKYIFLATLSLFVFVIYFKVFRLNQFVHGKDKLATAFKKDPEST
jgi:hypothetical protein